MIDLVIRSIPFDDDEKNFKKRKGKKKGRTDEKGMSGTCARARRRTTRHVLVEPPKKEK